MTLPAPYAPLVSGGEGLDRYPADPSALAARMAQIYGVPVEQILPVRGLTHGLELVWRLAARDGQSVQAPDAQPYTGLAAIYPSKGETAAVVIRALGSPEAVAEMAERVAPALLVVDEGLIEFADGASAVTVVERPRQSGRPAQPIAGLWTGRRPRRGGDRPGGNPRTTVVGAGALRPARTLVRLAQQALDPSRMIETAERIASVKLERARVAREVARLMTVESGVGPILMARPSDPEATLTELTRYGVTADRSGDRLRLPISIKPEVNDRLLLALGLNVPRNRQHSTGQAVRDTKETRIVCAVDLDATGPITIQTGVGFFDHMLEQVAAHGGFSLRLSCEGDLHTDPHHTIEDSAIALGQALKQALGERRGIARYGFVLAMDEAEAHVAIDLSGRPYPLFEGTFATPFIGEYRTDLTAHVFRSLAEAMGAAVHIKVTGDDDHHKTEAVYKGFGRALRQAIRIEGDAVPSTKGVL
jgi:imidazoleglycerol-phosphate dehydratase/histidinol-phosphatase